MNFLQALFGSPAERGSTYNKNQLSLIDQAVNQVKSLQKSGAGDISQQPAYQQGQNWLMSLFNDPEFFKSFEAPLQRQFQEQTIPDLANRFASMGSGGALGSTAFRNQLGREGSNLSTNIGALRGGMQQQAVPQLLGYAQQPFSNLMSLQQQALTPTQNTYTPASSGLLGGILPGLAGAAGIGYGQQFGQNMAGMAPSTQPGYGAGWDSMFRQQGAI